MKKNETRSFFDWKFQKTLLAVKTTLILVLVSVLQLSASVYSQNTRLNLKLNDLSLVEVFKEIRNSTEFTFVYDLEDVEHIKNLNINQNNASVEQVLDACLENTNLTYELVDKVVIVKEKKSESLKKIQKEKIKLKGTVTDKDGNPVPFASVCFKGTTNGCVAAVDGKFELEMEEDPNATLIVSCIGYQTIEMPVGGKTDFNIVLSSEIKGLDEVVVTGYQTIAKERATGSFGKINNEDLEATINMSVGEQLEGRVQGLLVHKGKIKIRGTSSLYANTEPLIVVDNIPLSYVGELDNINPDDIDNVVVLKDAAAASIYGVRAANGVIVITTKSGSASKRKYFDVEFSANYSIDEKVDISELNLMSSADAIDFEKEAILKNNWADYSTDAYDFTNMTYTARSYSRAQEIILNGQRNAADPGNMTDSELAAMNAQLASLSKNDLSKEYSKYLFQKQQIQRYNLSVLGNSENAGYRFSLLYEKNKGQKVGDLSERLSISSKTDLRLSQKSSVNINFVGAYSKQKNNGVATPLRRFKPYERIKDENGNKAPVYSYIPRHHIDHYTASDDYIDWNQYIMDEITERENSMSNLFVRLNIGYNYKIMEGLSFNSQLMGRTTVTNSEDLKKENSYEARNNYNTWTVEGVGQWGQPEMKHLFPRGGIQNAGYATSIAWTFRNQFSLDRAIGKDFRVSALFGSEINSEMAESEVIYKLGYDPQMLTYKTNMDWNIFSDYQTTDYAGERSMVVPMAEEGSYEDRFASFYGNASFHYQDKYSVSLSARRDQSNLFGAKPDYKKNLLWSAGFAWNVHNENFFNNKLFNRLTFRTTYGINGNVDKSTSPLLTIRPEYNYFGNKPAFVVENPPNELLRWEKTKVINIGVDFAILNNRIGGSFEFYNKNSIDLLGFQKLDYTYGFNSAKVNTASMYNRGVDLNLNFVPVSNADLRWDINLNYSYNYNKVTSVEVAQNTTTSYLSYDPIQGLPLNHLHVWKWAGLSDTGLAQVYDQDGNVTDYRTAVSDPKALDLAGVTVPKYYGGLQQRLSYKNWSASINFSYGFGHKMRLAQLDYMSAWYGNMDQEITKRWRKSGDELTTNVPVMPSSMLDVNSYRSSLYNKSSINVVDASYIHCKNMNVSYNLKKVSVFEKLKFTVQADNLWMWTANNKGVDPLAGYGNMSAPKRFTFAISGCF